jgi:hypothetical protein
MTGFLKIPGRSRVVQVMTPTDEYVRGEVARSD